MNKNKLMKLKYKKVQLEKLYIIKEFKILRKKYI